MDFSKQILTWYHKSHRKLPWRETNDPYLIWLSEIILQQTRVDQGTEYYLRFASRYPKVKDLALADEDEVLKLWQGLGYYSRARNLLFAAKQIMNDHNGAFPDNYAELKKLKGVGDYTAAAIASIAFGEVVPVVDGNVKRVAARIYGYIENGQALYNIVKKKMEELIDEDNPGDFNQAVMEFGAMQCTPQNPDCQNCIFKDDCFACIHNKVLMYPSKEKKTKVKNRYFSYLIIQDPEHRGVYLQKRSGNDIWKNLYEFPLIETQSDVNEETLSGLPEFLKLLGTGGIISKISKSYKHKLSHRTINARFYKVEPSSNILFEPATKWEYVKHENISKYPVSRLIERYLEDNE